MLDAHSFIKQNWLVHEYKHDRGCPHSCIYDFGIFQIGNACLSFKVERLCMTIFKLVTRKKSSCMPPHSNSSESTWKKVNALCIPVHKKIEHPRMVKHEDSRERLHVRHYFVCCNTLFQIYILIWNTYPKRRVILKHPKNILNNKINTWYLIEILTIPKSVIK